MADGKTSVGLENTTSFVRAVRGKLVAVATPVRRGRGSQVWEVAISDEGGRLAATTGRVRTLSLEAGRAVAGEGRAGSKRRAPRGARRRQSSPATERRVLRPRVLRVAAACFLRRAG